MSFVKTETLTRSAYAHLAQLINEYRTLKEPADNPKAEAIAQDVIERYNSPKQRAELRMADFRAFEIALLCLKPTLRLRHEAWNLRRRYSEVVGPRAYSIYLQTNPPNPVTATERELRTDLEFIQSETFRHYLFLASREDLRTKFAMWVAFLTIVICGTAVIAVSYSVSGHVQDTLYKRFTLIISLVITSGTVGGAMSVQNRLQTSYCDGDPVSNITQLRHGWFSLFQAPLSGAVFALLIYVLLAGQFLEGVVFPKLIVRASDATAAAVELGKAGFQLQNLRATAPASIMDFAKLLIWCFLAGFAERFVPDTLTRLVGEGKKPETPSAAVIPPHASEDAANANASKLTIAGPANVSHNAPVSYQAFESGHPAVAVWSVDPPDAGEITPNPVDASKAEYLAKSSHAVVTVIAKSAETERTGQLPVKLKE